MIRIVCILLLWFWFESECIIFVSLDYFTEKGRSVGKKFKTLPHGGMGDMTWLRPEFLLGR